MIFLIRIPQDPRPSYFLFPRIESLCSPSGSSGRRAEPLILTLAESSAINCIVAAVDRYTLSFSYHLQCLPPLLLLLCSPLVGLYHLCNARWIELPSRTAMISSGRTQRSPIELVDRRLLKPTLRYLPLIISLPSALY